MPSSVCTTMTDSSVLWGNGGPWCMSLTTIWFLQSKRSVCKVSCTRCLCLATRTQHINSSQTLYSTWMMSYVDAHMCGIRSCLNVCYNRLLITWTYLQISKTSLWTLQWQCVLHHSNWTKKKLKIYKYIFIYYFIYLVIYTIVWSAFLKIFPVPMN
jgi:hypothetical protein